MLQQYLAAIAIAWYCLVVLVITIGVIQLFRHFTVPISQSTSSRLPIDDVPHVTIIRPIVGLEPYLEDCLVSTFTQKYPISKLTISLCISSSEDSALPILKDIIARYPQYDARIYIETEDPNLRAKDGGQARNLGPNPKIRNMSRAYREAKGDIIWIADCNVWLQEETAGLMVDLLCGFQHGKTQVTKDTMSRKYKFVHQLPLAVDISHLPPCEETLLAGRPLEAKGGLLEELFMSTSHVKFYTAISTVAIAPCTVGKSNMFRKSHLDALTQPGEHTAGQNSGIDFFSNNICEDHLIGDLLWKTSVPQSVIDSAAKEGLPKNAGSTASNKSWRHHALLLNPPCIQPQYNTKISSYAARRTRWLRVRKFTVPVATLVEPGTESLVACLGLAWGLTTSTWSEENLHIPPTWSSFAAIWLTTNILWLLVDKAIWSLLQSWPGSYTKDPSSTPIFVSAAKSRTLSNWLQGWFVREILAFPIWAWAVVGGSEVIWRGRRFWVSMDMKVHEINEPKSTSKKRM